MITTANMGLIAWDQASDYFSHTQLAGNFQAIDDHDHTTGNGKKIPYGGLGPGSVGVSELRADAVQTANIVDSQVTTPKLAAGAVTKAKMDPGVRQDTGLFSAHRNTTVSLATGAVIVNDIQDYDPSSWYDPTTGIWTCGLDGYYWFGWSVGLSPAINADEYFTTLLTFNGSSVRFGGVAVQRGSFSVISQGNTVLSLTSGTQIGLKIQHNHSGTVTVAGSSSATFFQGHLVTA